MFVVELVNEEVNQSLEVYLVSTEGKAWMLKQFLTACAVPKDKEGAFEWSESDVIGKKILGSIEHITEDWIDREGKKQTSTKAKLAEFKELPL
jgi:hypothetical protein